MRPLLGQLYLPLIPGTLLFMFLTTALPTIGFKKVLLTPKNLILSFMTAWLIFYSHFVLTTSSIIYHNLIMILISMNKYNSPVWNVLRLFWWVWLFLILLYKACYGYTNITWLVGKIGLNTKDEACSLTRASSINIHILTFIFTLL